MPTTSNFGWTTPADTDLVKDGAAAIRTLGNGIDTSFVDLKGGTTGQVLSKASNTDLDFTWVAQDDSNAIQNAIVDAKGDLITATAADTPTRLASSGVNGNVLTVDTTTATGVKWAAPAGGKILQVVSGSTSTETTSSSSTFADTGLSATITPTSASSTILILVSQNGIGKFSGNTQAQFRLLRGATTILNFESFAGHTANTDANFIGGVSAGYVDSPATTSATTYKTQFNSQANIGTVKIQDNNSPGSTSTIILMEVGA